MRAFLDFFRRLHLVPQGITIVAAAFLPIFAIASMFPAVPTIIDHFAGDPDAKWKVPLMVSAPGLTIAIFAPFAGYFADRFGRRPILLVATFTYALFGTAPFFLESLNAVFATRLLLGISEAAILTSVNTLIGDYWNEKRRRDWLFLQGIAGPFLASGVILLAGPATAIRWNGMFLVYLVAVPIFLAMVAFLFEPKRDGVTVSEVVKAPTASPFPTRSVATIGGDAGRFRALLCVHYQRRDGVPRGRHHRSQDLEQTDCDAEPVRDAWSATFLAARQAKEPRPARHLLPAARRRTGGARASV